MARILCPKAVELLADMPPYMSGDPMVQAVVNAYACEWARIEAAAQAIVDAMFPAYADDVVLADGIGVAPMLSMWEVFLGLPMAPAGVSLADRRAKVTAYIQKRNSGKGSDWVSVITQALGSGFQWSHLEGPAAYQVTLTIPYQSGSYTSTQVAALARAITPAHLAIDVEYTGGFIVGSPSLIGTDSI